MTKYQLAKLKNMAVRECSASSNESAMRLTDIENIEQASELHRYTRGEYLSYGLNCPSTSRSLSRINRPFYRRHRQRWKLRHCLRCTSTAGDEDTPSSRDAPPTYSSICAGPISRSERVSFTFPINDRLSVTERIPPPTYAQTEEFNFAASIEDSFISLSSNARSTWPRVPTNAICPRCTAFIITVVVIHRSVYTHLTALTLFLFGCWPCCAVPYCIDSCNNADHYCPICRTYLGTYAP